MVVVRTQHNAGRGVHARAREIVHKAWRQKQRYHQTMAVNEKDGRLRTSGKVKQVALLADAAMLTTFFQKQRRPQATYYVLRTKTVTGNNGWATKTGTY